MTINPEDHLNLAYKIATRWNMPQYKFPVEERISVALLALVEASKGFDPSKGYRFSTYAHTTIRNHLHKYGNEHCRPGIRIPRSNKTDRFIPKAEHLDTQDRNDLICTKSKNPLLSTQNKELINDILGRCSPQQKIILKEILKGIPQKQIAADLKCSNQHISHQYQKILKRERKLNEDAKNS